MDNKSGGIDMKNFEKYKIGYFAPPEMDYTWMKKDHIEKAPAWCSASPQKQGYHNAHKGGWG